MAFPLLPVLFPLSNRSFRCKVVVLKFVASNLEIDIILEHSEEDREASDAFGLIAWPK